MSVTLVYGGYGDMLCLLGYLMCIRVDLSRVHGWRERGTRYNN